MLGSLLLHLLMHSLSLVRCFLLVDVLLGRLYYASCFDVQFGRVYYACRLLMPLFGLHLDVLVVVLVDLLCRWSSDMISHLVYCRRIVVCLT